MNKTRAFAVGCLLADTKCASAKASVLVLFPTIETHICGFPFSIRISAFPAQELYIFTLFSSICFCFFVFRFFFDFIYSFSCYKRIPSSIIWLSLKCSAIWLCFLSSVIFVLLYKIRLYFVDSFIFALSLSLWRNSYARVPSISLENLVFILFLSFDTFSSSDFALFNKIAFARIRVNCMMLSVCSWIQKRQGI